MTETRWHTERTDDVLERLASTRSGLTDSEATRRLAAVDQSPPAIAENPAAISAGPADAIVRTHFSPFGRGI